MLQGDLFTIQSIQKEENAAKVFLTLNDTHPLFEGHFPGRPILPGACQLQIVKEIMQSILNTDIQLKRATQMKFLSLISPVTIIILQVDLKYIITDTGELNVIAEFSYNDIVFFKFNGIFTTSSQIFSGPSA